MEEQAVVNAPISGSGPLVTKRRFAELSGLTEETIRGMVERGHLPTVKVGRHRLVNVALITRDALESDYD